MQPIYLSTLIHRWPHVTRTCRLISVTISTEQELRRYIFLSRTATRLLR
ncbi:hypothetical protein PUN28_003964 [Cardiocondyla obscurior]|uniref:Uncharacterized protein n=1 Tax=Cardiocondyla obscurior TaxID=286306 RepID=A0AAW2GL30_9HYME